jgi:hypothetical protein
MAIRTGSQAGIGPLQIQGALAVAPIRYGNSTAATVATAVSVTLALPVDPNGNAYAAYRVITSVAMWAGFGAGPATVAAANEWIQASGVPQDIVPPSGPVLTNIGAVVSMSFIPADAGTAGSISITGLY